MILLPLLHASYTILPADTLHINNCNQYQLVLFFCALGPSFLPPLFSQLFNAGMPYFFFLSIEINDCGRQQLVAILRQFWKEMLLTRSDDNMMLAMDKMPLPTFFFTKKPQFPKLSTIQISLTNFIKINSKRI